MGEGCCYLTCYIMGSLVNGIQLCRGRLFEEDRFGRDWTYPVALAVDKTLGLFEDLSVDVGFGGVGAEVG